jgi:hypothetical protein
MMNDLHQGSMISFLTDNESLNAPFELKSTEIPPALKTTSQSSDKFPDIHEFFSFRRVHMIFRPSRFKKRRG